MKIELSQPYKSITTLITEDLPDFAVLIGRNGAGKTQLLDALEEGTATIPGISVDEIEKYDMVDFRPPNTGQANRHANQFAQMTADAYLLSPTGGQPPIETAAAIFDQFAGEIERDSGAQAREDFERNLKDEIQQLPDFAVFAVDAREPSYKRTLYEKVLGLLVSENAGRRGRRSSNQPKNSFDGNQAALLSTAMKVNDRLPHELTYDDIMRASHFEGQTLSNSVSAVFAAYKVDQFIQAHKQIETESVDFANLITEYRTKYPPPWETLREILFAMRDAAGDDGLFDFDFSDPDGYELHMGNYERFSFRAEMTNRTTSAKYELDSLSSGEKVLMALCLASFNQQLGRRLPKLLLLDEVDAVLHPSMVAALVTTLKTLFVAQGTKVLMTTHSPMTVASLDETDIFRVVRTGGRVEITETTKSEAVSELSEGLATVDVGLKIAASDGAAVTILTEGNNAKHLIRWVNVMGLSKEVHVFEELVEHTSAGELRMYGRLLGRMNTNTHFIVVWDCDAAGEAKGLRQELRGTTNVTPFAFTRRPENTIARRGIENNYDADFLKPFSIKKMDDNDMLLGRFLPKDRKSKFASHVFREGTPEYFTHFQDLHDAVRRVLDLH